MNSDLDLLLRLRDLHAPAEPGWWPPAPGWWLLVLPIALTLWAMVRWLPPRLARWHQHRCLRRDLALLTRRLGADADTSRQAGELSFLLRRAVIVKTGDRSIAGTHGDAWVDWLRQRAPEVELLAEQPALLTALPYQSHVSTHDLNCLASLVRRIIDAPLDAGQC